MYKFIAIVMLLFYFVVSVYASEMLIQKSVESKKPTTIDKILKEMHQ